MRNKIIFFDLDGTLVDGYEFIYQHLWGYFGVDKAATREVLKSYLRKEISYEDWVKNDVRLLKEVGATKAKILDAISTLKPMKGAVETLAELRDRGYRIVVVSGGIDLVVEAAYPSHKDLFDEVYINRYFFGEDGIVSHAEATKYDMEHKATCIKDVAASHGVSPQQCVFVGDNHNDVQAALEAGTSIAFNCNSDELAQAATHIVEGKDLRAILPHIK